jgi:hypothetical protein
MSLNIGKITEFVGPFQGSRPIVPDDIALIKPSTKAMIIGTGGDVTVVLDANSLDDPVTFPAVPSGTILNVRAQQVKATATTALNIVALF